MKGRTLAGRYRVVAPIGEGGMAYVYRALDLASGAEVALKVLREELAGDAELAQRFRREAKLCRALESPHTVRVLDAGSDGEATYMVLELVRGTDLLDVLATEGRLSERRAASILMQVCEALDEAHRLTIIHRDLTPDNVMIVPELSSPDGEFVKVLDFGIAKILDEQSFALGQAQRGAQESILSALTAVSSRLGTPAYMSPEQGRQEPVEARTDLYACGVLLYELLTGAPPFDGETPLVVLLSHVEEAPVPPSEIVEMHPALEVTILRALSKWPRDRQESAAALGRELLAMMPDLSATPRPLR